MDAGARIRYFTFERPFILLPWSQMGTALRNIGWLAFWSQMGLMLVASGILMTSTGLLSQVCAFEC